MTGAVNLNKPLFVEVAAGHWQGAPEWVMQLAAEADRTTLTAAAARIGYSVGLVSQVIRAKYPGDLEKVEIAVRGALMGETVGCPVLGEIGRDRCLHEQGMPRAATSAIRARLYHACRSGCPHSRIKGGDDVAVADLA